MSIYQRISVLAASSPAGRGLDDASNTDDYLKAVSYSSIASVIRQCDKPRGSGEPSGSFKPSGASLEANSVRPTRRPGRRTLNSEQLAAVKARSTCHKCDKKGHWASDHG